MFTWTFDSFIAAVFVAAIFGSQALAATLDCHLAIESLLENRNPHIPNHRLKMTADFPDQNRSLLVIEYNLNVKRSPENEIEIILRLVYLLMRTKTHHVVWSFSEFPKHLSGVRRLPQESLRIGAIRG